MSDGIIKISGSKLEATVLPYGARLADLRLQGHDGPLILRYEELSDFQSDKMFMGAVIGRYGNRIEGGVAQIDGQEVSLEKNEGGIRHLHGGKAGFSEREWILEECKENHVRFVIESHNGDAGYPGNLIATAEYSIIGDNILRLDLSAIVDATSVVNLCHHPYFNFTNGTDLNDHKLQINTKKFLPSDENLVPTGEIASVKNTPFDFHELTSLTDAKGKPKHSYNNTYCLNMSSRKRLQYAAKLSAQNVEMEIWTTQPGVHLYNGYKINRSATGFNGKPMNAFSGICLEAQNWPDSPNRENFPNCILRAGEKYSQRTEYRFKAI